MSAAVKVAIRVAVDPLKAFEVFTRDIATWWHRDARYQFLPGGQGFLRFEPGVGGRLLETSATGTFVVGEIFTWEPGKELGFFWKATNFRADQKTRVTIRFEPCMAGTRIVLEHSGWEAIPADHPVRHGMPALMFMKNQAAWWQDLLRSLKASTEAG